MIHTLSVLVENKPGALMRITSLFVRRGFNIESLAVGPTERSDVSRITMRVNCEQHTLEQIEKQMHKLVNVLRVNELEPGEAVEGERLLVKAAAPPDRRAGLMGLRGVFHPRGIARHQGARPPGPGRALARLGDARAAAAPPLGPAVEIPEPTTERTPDGEDTPGRQRRPALGQGGCDRLRQPGTRPW